MTARPLLPVALCAAMAALSPLLAAPLDFDRGWGGAIGSILLSAPPWWLLLGALGALSTALRRRSWVAAVLALPLAAGALWPLGAADVEPGEGLTVVSANLNAFATGGEEIDQAIAALRPDLVITIERRGDDIPGLERVADNFDRDLLKPSHGSAGFCRPALGCAGWVSETLGTFDCRFPIVHLRVEGLCVVGVHLPPPISHCVQGRAPYLAALLPHLVGGRIADDWGACRAGDAAAVVGDLNGVPFGPAWRALRDRGLRDTLPWSGVIAGTWPAGGGWGALPALRLDHALLGAASAGKTRRARLPGSDHLALVVEDLKPRSLRIPGGGVDKE